MMHTSRGDRDTGRCDSSRTSGGCAPDLSALARDCEFATDPLYRPTAGLLLSGLVHQGDIRAVRKFLSATFDIGIPFEEKPKAQSLLSCRLNSDGQFLAKKLRGGPVLDLGCGRDFQEFALAVSVLLGASRYAGIDLSLRPTTKGRFDSLDYTLSLGDILLSTAALESQSIGLTLLFGFEGSRHRIPGNERYCEALSRQLRRVIRPGGIWLCDRVTLEHSPMGHAANQKGFTQTLSVDRIDSEIGGRIAVFEREQGSGVVGT